jgi:hypothetical protein
MSNDPHAQTQALIEAWGRHVLSMVQIQLEEVRINQGRVLSVLNHHKASQSLSDYEFKVFSQWGEDGIIQHLIRSIDIKNKTFIEFGVEDFFESNCRFLMLKDDWKGFVIDGSEFNINRLRSSYFFWKHHLLAKQAFVTKDNINELLNESEFDQDLGILSIDIDGVDYFVFDSITSYKPRILILEFNPIFGVERKITIPYSADFNRTKAHYSNLYFGASLAAMTYLAEKKGYGLVGTASAGGNAFFVREDLLNERVQRLTAAQAYRPFNCRESRDESGQLTFLGGDDRINAIRGLPVLNVETGHFETL